METVGNNRQASASSGLARQRRSHRCSKGQNFPGRSTPRARLRSDFISPHLSFHAHTRVVGVHRGALQSEFLPGQGCPAGKPVPPAGYDAGGTAVSPIGRDACCTPGVQPWRLSPVPNPYHFRQSRRQGAAGSRREQKRMSARGHTAVRARPDTE